MSNWPTPTHDSPKAKAARAVSPGYSYCLRCGMPWRLRQVQKYIAEDGTA